MRHLLCSPPFVRFICARMWASGVLPAALPAPFSATLSPALSVYLLKHGATGSASGQTACPVSPTLCQSGFLHGNTSPLHPGGPYPPVLQVWMKVYFLFPCCRTSLLFDFLSVLVVRGGAVCPPTLPSWFSDLVFTYLFCLIRSDRFFGVLIFVVCLCVCLCVHFFSVFKKVCMICDFRIFCFFPLIFIWAF